MKKVALVNPPQLNSIDDRLDPPLGLMYIAGSLEREEISVSINDLAGRKVEEWGNLIDDADIYGMTIFSSSFNVSRDISKFIKARNKDAIIVAGGPHPTSLPDQTIDTGDFDYVIQREGEEAFPKLIRSLSAGNSSDKIITAEQIKDINLLPRPARHLVDISSYTREVEGEQATSIITSRGCPYTCSFCCKDIHGRKVRFREAEDIIDEVRGIQETYGVNSFVFYDDIFTLNRKRLEVLCEEFKNMDLTFRCNGRSGANTFEDYVKLREAGCKEIAFGIESGSQEILERVNKGTTVEMNTKTITEAKRAGLLTKAYLIVGYPGETQETIDETKKFMEITDPDKFTLFQFVPLPGSDVWKNPDKYGVTEVNNDWDEFYNIAGQYEGGNSFRTAELTPERITYLHDDLLNDLMHRRKGEDHGQRGTLQNYYKNIKE